MTNVTKKAAVSKKTTSRFPVKLLVTAVGVGLLSGGAMANTFKNIGDLEIYQAAKDGKVTLTMMLDTSGSMSEELVDNTSACDMPSFQGDDRLLYVDLKTEKSNTVPSYKRVICEHDGKSVREYRYFYIPDLNMYYDCTQTVRCGDIGAFPINGNPITKFPNKKLKQVRNPWNFDYGNKRYKGYHVYEIVSVSNPRPPMSNPDRITRLKDAIFNLMDSSALDSKSVAVGIGQYSTQTDSNNAPLATGATGKTGKIVVPAALLDDVQRAKIKQAVASFYASHATPTAMAYAEVGAYMLGTHTKTSSASSGFDESVTTSKTSNNYISPLSDTALECDGQGIYFLTDGEPNSSVNPSALMRVALGSKGSAFSVYGNGGTLPNGSQNGHGMPEVGAFAKMLRTANQNPKNVSIRTAVVGFGSVFDTANYTNIIKELPTAEVDKSTGLPIPGKFKQGEKSRYFDCSLIPANKIDARNACNWGAKSHPSLPGVGGYGEGGFYSAQSTQDVINSVTTFLGDLTQTIGSAPAGTISIPRDPLSADSIQPYAYLPTLAPEVASKSTIWKGNLKKYHTLYGTLWGSNNRRLYKKGRNPTPQNVDYPYEIDSLTMDVWQKVDKGNNSGVDVGGAYEHLAAPSQANKNNIRTVFVEVVDGDKKSLVQVGIRDGNLVDFDKLKGYSVEDMTYLVNYLGYKVDVIDANKPKSFDELKSKTREAYRNNAFNDRLLGGVIHSVPVLASYSGVYDDDGGITSDESKRQDYLLYGSMDGALHMVEAATGVEKFAFIPRSMFENQREALLVNSQHSKLGQPVFGVDAPWEVYADYSYDISLDENKANRIDAKEMFAYGGLRMGGVGFYGLDLSDMTKKDGKPRLKFSIAKSSDSTSPLSRLGQTWSKPTVVTLKTGPKPQDKKDVLVVAGGYDMCYENPNFKLNAANDDKNCENKAMADGNAVYMFDAKDGQLLASWTAPKATGGGLVGSGDGRQHMVHSIVGEVVSLDRNNNGAVDYLYFADLGGQIFRIDLKEGVAPTDSSFTRRVVRVFDANGGSLATEADHINYRFYEAPVISWAQHGAQRFAVVNIASGDRSSPVHASRKIEDANRIFGIFDRDLRTGNLLHDNVAPSDLLSVDITNDDLHHLDTQKIENSKESYIKPIFADLQSSVLSTDPKNKTNKQGWYYDMTRFDGYVGVPNLKSVGAGLVTGGIYYASIYSPDYQYAKVGAGACHATIKGGTERQLYCLPWGICANAKTGVLTDGSVNGVLSYSKAGPGIQEMAVGTIASKAGQSSNFRVVIGQQSLSESRTGNGRQTVSVKGGDSAFNELKDKDKIGFGTGSGADIAGILPEQASWKVFRVERWYDLQNAENN